MFYAAKNEDDVAFRDDLEDLRERVELEIVYVLEEPSEDWDGESGFISAEMLDRRLPEENFKRFFFICGPPPMMDAIHTAIRSMGVPEAHIQLERFNLA